MRVYFRLSVFSVSSDDLRNLFTYKPDTLSDTFESLNIDPSLPLSTVQVCLLPVSIICNLFC